MGSEKGMESWNPFLSSQLRILILKGKKMASLCSGDLVWWCIYKKLLLGIDLEKDLKASDNMYYFLVKVIF